MDCLPSALYTFTFEELDVENKNEEDNGRDSFIKYTFLSEGSILDMMEVFTEK
jgi:hypothetical protein